MHITVTDILACPQCGPEHGLILLAEDVADRRVSRGVLGCPDCRTHFVIEDGVALLSSPEPWDDAPEDGSAGRSSLTDAVEWAALLGVTEGPAKLVLAGPATRHAADLAGLIPNVEVIAIVNGEPPRIDQRVSTIRATGTLPLRSGVLNGVGLSGSVVDVWLEPALRALRTGGRIVLDPAPEDAPARLAANRSHVLLNEHGTIVAVREQ